MLASYLTDGGKCMNKGSWFFLLLLLVFVQTWAVAQSEQLTADQEQRIRRLEQIIEQQQQRIEALQQSAKETAIAPRQVASPQTQGDYAERVAAEYVKSSDAEQEGAEFGYEGRGFFLRVPNFELYMSGFIQMGLAFFENDTPDNNGFFPNGVVLCTDVYLFNDFHARLELNFMGQLPGLTAGSRGGFEVSANVEGTQVWDAYVEYLGFRDAYDNPQFAVRVGQTHVPFTIGGQWNPNQGIGIWTPPFLASWSHGRDPGLMFWGVLSDMVEYKLSMHNGDGRSTINGTDDMLYAGSIRLFPFKRSENANTFFHVGVIRSRADQVNGFGNVNSASLRTPWGRPVYDSLNVPGASTTQGWKTGVDTGMSVQMYLGEDKVNFIRLEGEFMYITWQRDFATGRLPWLEGFGGNIGIMFRHNFTPDVEGAGLFPLFHFSYSDIDNKNTDDLRFGSDIVGQRIFTYTFGLGYAFNKHICMEVDWVMADVEKDVYYGNGNAAKNDRIDGSDDIEHGWFFQVTAAW